MTKIFSLDDWEIIDKIPSEKRMVFATIYIKHPDWKMIAKLDLPKRKNLEMTLLNPIFKN